MADTQIPRTLGSCKTCGFWSSIEYTHRNHCRRHAPTVLIDPTDGEVFHAVWPKTYGDDGCGEWMPE